jgi:hypothetical protein
MLNFTTNPVELHDWVGVIVCVLQEIGCTELKSLEREIEQSKDEKRGRWEIMIDITGS